MFGTRRSTVFLLVAIDINECVLCTTTDGHFYSARRANKGNVFVLTIIFKFLLCPKLFIHDCWPYFFSCAVTSWGFTLKMILSPVVSYQVCKYVLQMKIHKYPLLNIFLIMVHKIYSEIPKCVSNCTHDALIYG